MRFNWIVAAIIILLLGLIVGLVIPMLFPALSPSLFYDILWILGSVILITFAARWMLGLIPTKED